MSATWFRCDPSKLIGALSGMAPEHGYVYTMILMRIYEVGGPIDDDEHVLARRTGYAVKKVAEAIQWLVQRDKIQRLENGLLDSRTTHEELAYREKLIKDAQNAGNVSGKKRLKVSFKKGKQNQQIEPTTVELTLNSRSTCVERPSTEEEVDRELEDNNNNPPSSTIPEGGRILGFEEFWSIFPKGEFVSKPKAAEAYAELTPAERLQAIAAIPALKARKPTTNPLSPDRYLRERLFASSSSSRPASRPMVKVERISPQGDAWDEFIRAKKGKSVPWSNGAWHFPTEWPPDAQLQRAAE